MFDDEEVKKPEATADPAPAPEEVVTVVKKKRVRKAKAKPAEDVKPEAEPAPAAPPPTPKKKRASKPAAKKKKAASKGARKSAKPSATSIEAVLGARAAGTKKAKLLAFLLANVGEIHTRNKLVSAVYGKADDESTRAFAMCMAGLIKTLKEKRQPYNIVRERNEKEEVTFALLPKT